MRILFYIYILIPIIAFGQKINTQDILNPHPLDMRKSKTSFHTIHLGSSDTKDVEKYLKNNISNLKNSPYTSLKLLHNIESPGGIHLTYRQLYNSTPVYGSQVKVNLNKEGHIKSIFDHSSPPPIPPKGGRMPTHRNPSPSPNNFPDTSIVSAYLSNIRSLKSNDIENVYFFNEGQLIPAVKLEISESDHSYYEVIINNEGKVLYKKDLVRYFLPFMQDSVVIASVFMPDPLTTASVTYGSPYVDSSDSDVSELNAERVNVNITVDFTNDTFRLISPYVKITELSSPTVAPVYSTIPSFIYTRSQPGFEDVNAYYHINVFQQYIQSLGFTNLVNFQIRVDAHALNGNDNSQFNKPDILLFGEGGVDDAEDADVIIHEYGHAILESAAPNTWSGTERKALDEGLGDYLATSYSRDINPFNWQDMFSWDGHNEFWSGRTTASTKHYPEDLGSGIWLDGEIWSSALMQIWEDIGRTTTDQILLQSLYSYAAGMTMVDAAYLFFQADSSLNSGANITPICNRFSERGLITSPNAGTDQTVSYDTDTIYLNGSVIGAAGGVWSTTGTGSFIPNDSTLDVVYIISTADSIAGIITFALTTTGNGSCPAKTDTILVVLSTVNVNEISEGKNIQILNTEGFSTGNGDVIIKFYKPTSAIIKLMDIRGSIVFEKEVFRITQLPIDGNLFSKGVYILNVQTPFKTTNFKLIKL